METQNIRIRLKAFDHRVLDQAAGDIADTAHVPGTAGVVKNGHRAKSRTDRATELRVDLGGRRSGYGLLRFNVEDTRS